MRASRDSFRSRRGSLIKPYLRPSDRLHSHSRSNKEMEFSKLSWFAQGLTGFVIRSVQSRTTSISIQHGGGTGTRPADKERVDSPVQAGQIALLLVTDFTSPPRLEDGLTLACHAGSAASTLYSGIPAITKDSLTFESCICQISAANPVSALHSGARATGAVRDHNTSRSRWCVSEVDIQVDLTCQASSSSPFPLTLPTALNWLVLIFPTLSSCPCPIANSPVYVLILPFMPTLGPLSKLVFPILSLSLLGCLAVATRK